MGKSVFIYIGEGSFEAGFPIAMRLGEDGQASGTGVSGRLPPAPEIREIYRTWQISRMMRVGRMKAKPGFPTNVSLTNSSEALKDSINLWLDSEEFRPIRDKLLEKLSQEDEVLAIFQGDDPLLWRLPWFLWDLFDRNSNVEVALSPSRFEAAPVAREPKSQKERVQILAILGDSEGIDIEQDRALLLEELPDAEVTFLVEPERSHINDRLWERPWDILFFAGHSLTEDDATGKIFINEKDSLSVEDLKYALKQAIRQGLKIAIFNSCDGLGLAKELADLHIPQTVVMREPVPDPVAQEFLKNFLKAFSRGKSFYLAVREARERLQGLETRFPRASWLPAIWQNPGARALRWQDLTGEADLEKGSEENKKMSDPTQNQVTNPQPNSDSAYRPNSATAGKRRRLQDEIDICEQEYKSLKRKRAAIVKGLDTVSDVIEKDNLKQRKVELEQEIDAVRGKLEQLEIRMSQLT